MRFWCSVVCAAVLATGGVLASDELTPMSTIVASAGDDLPIRVRTTTHTVKECFLVGPSGKTVQFIPEDLSDNKYELNEPGILYGCQVTIKKLDEDDNGIWQLAFTGEEAENGQVAEGQQFYNVTVTPQEGAYKEVESTEEDTQDYSLNEITLNYTTIRYGVKLGTNVTLSLSNKEGSDEECYLVTPQGSVATLKNTSMTGVQVYFDRTPFVSCRIVIGPMDETLLGTWHLCGKYLKTSDTLHKRCQPAVVSWASDNPSDNWVTDSHPHFEHAVHYGFTLAPIVRGSGTRITCHVITPAGEDIALTTDNDYPGLELVVFQRDTTACSVTFGPIDANFLGEWVIYGTYQSAIVGFNVARLPMRFSLYDEENPLNHAYNVTYLDEETYMVSEDTQLTVIVNGVGTRNDCELMDNSGRLYRASSNESMAGITFNNLNNACRLQIGPINRKMFSRWTLIGKFSRNNLFTELRLPFNLIEEDPENPQPDPIERTIQYLDTLEQLTYFGTTETFWIPSDKRITTESCHIRTPDNLQYVLRDDTIHPRFHATSLQRGNACGVTVHIDDESAIGEWMLIARMTDRGTRIERRRPFIVQVEDEVNAVPKTTTVARGGDLYIRLETPTALHETCSLTGPTRNDAERDDQFLYNCGFIVSDVTLADTGIWTLFYGSRIKYKAYINVTVTDRFESLETSTLYWIEGLSQNITVGPENAVYCRVEAPTGLTVFDGFGECRIVLDQVRQEHMGEWKMTVAMPGQVRAETHYFVVRVDALGPKPKVETSVTAEKPEVTLSCEIFTLEREDVTACKFRTPSDEVLLATPGVGEDRYSFYSGNGSTEANVSTTSCGLRITNPIAKDLGIWRCVIETEKDTYYGFLTVHCPWVTRDPDIAPSVLSEPTLTAENKWVRAIEGVAVTMRCSVQSAIRYCYFRSQNGTVYNIRPGTSEWYGYAGAGLDAGECSIRFPGLHAEDSGHWSCHVGFHHHEPEQRAQIELHVEALMIATQFRDPYDNEVLIIRGEVHSRRALSYCRFVRIDGQGFTSEDVPVGYEDHSLLSNGKCEIRIRNPIILESHPWAVVAKILGQDKELTRFTNHTITVSDDTVPPESRPDSNFMVIWTLVLLISLALFFVGVMLGPKKNRQWTYQRTAAVRNSIRMSLVKRPLPNDNAYPRTPTAA